MIPSDNIPFNANSALTAGYPDFWEFAGVGSLAKVARIARPFLRKVIDASKAGASAAKTDWTKD